MRFSAPTSARVCGRTPSPGRARVRPARRRIEAAQPSTMAQKPGELLLLHKTGASGVLELLPGAGVLAEARSLREGGEAGCAASLPGSSDLLAGCSGPTDPGVALPKRRFHASPSASNPSLTAKSTRSLRSAQKSAAVSNTTSGRSSSWPSSLACIASRARPCTRTQRLVFTVARPAVTAPLAACLAAHLVPLASATAVPAHLVPFVIAPPAALACLPAHFVPLAIAPTAALAPWPTACVAPARAATAGAGRRGSGGACWSAAMGPTVGKAGHAWSCAQHTPAHARQRVASSAGAPAAKRTHQAARERSSL
mmetsp:Transcript_41343/g.95780  ORF Transcript_41343/g.95780 Transcript_41343/m.95780 type:complete len:311 (+) Transcript_41343:729-1661(+)